MKSGYLKQNYLALGKRINTATHIIVTFRIESPVPLRDSAQIVAAESSVGTWTTTKTMKAAMFRRLSAKVISVSPNDKLVRIAYPLELFEPGNIPQLLSSVAGNVFSMKLITKLRLEDLKMPAAFLHSFLGPAHGIVGIRRLLGVPRRPLIGAIMKPKMGLSWREHAKFAADCFLGGADLVKDDENLTDQRFNPFQKRVRETLRLAKEIEKKTGERKMCVFNITAPASEMIRRARFIKQSGGNCAMIDIMTAGFAGVQAVRQAKTGLIIHAHRAMHSVMTRDPKHGISMLVIAKLARLAGVDQLHSGTVVGKMEGSARETVAINTFLKSPWGNIKPVMPIASGGLHPRLVPKLLKIIGPDVIINFGGGIHGHPGGTLAGARAAKQAVEAVTSHQRLSDYAKTHPELQTALHYWR
ncbi:MAG: ribulose-bisphosphate carboxylase large subunit [Patescibacteria group bacterium]